LTIFINIIKKKPKILTTPRGMLELKKLNKGIKKLENNKNCISSRWDKLKDYEKNIVNKEYYNKEIEKLKNEIKEKKERGLEKEINWDIYDLKKKKIKILNEINDNKRKIYKLRSSFVYNCKKIKEANKLKREIQKFFEKFNNDKDKIKIRISNLSLDEKIKDTKIVTEREILNSNLNNLNLNIKVDEVNIPDNILNKEEDDFCEKIIGILNELKAFEKNINIEFKKLSRKMRQNILKKLIYLIKNLIYGAQNDIEKNKKGD